MIVGEVLEGHWVGSLLKLVGSYSPASDDSTSDSRKLAPAFIAFPASPPSLCSHSRGSLSRPLCPAHCSTFPTPLADPLLYDLADSYSTTSSNTCCCNPLGGGTLPPFHTGGNAVLLLLLPLEVCLLKPKGGYDTVLRTCSNLASGPRKDLRPKEPPPTPRSSPR